jgi:energy-coupling factor transporter ATP-binding protein EcfA2
MLEVQEVHFSYASGVKALKGVSLTVKDGEFVAIMGQNGAGKTTLVKHFNGLLKPTSGSVHVDGVETTKTTVAKLARSVGFVFQNPDHQLFSETVEDEIAFALKNFGYEADVIENRITWAVNLLGLTQYRKTSPFMLSGGERKRVALASVLAWDPKILILDEPTIGQDHRQKENLRQFIMLWRRGDYERFRRLKIPKSLLAYSQLRPQNEVRLRLRCLRGSHPLRLNHTFGRAFRHANPICAFGARAEAVASLSPRRSISGRVYFLH